MGTALLMQNQDWLRLKSAFNHYFAYQPFRKYSGKESFKYVCIFAAVALFDHILFTMFSVDAAGFIEMFFELLLEQF